MDETKTTDRQVVTEAPVIPKFEDQMVRPELVEDWKKIVEQSLDVPKEERAYAHFVLSQIGSVIAALHTGLSPADAIATVAPDTTLIQIGEVVKGAISFSPRGQELRVWWNNWHDRPNPDPSKVFNPSEINVKGKVLRLVGLFDPQEPLTKKKEYLEIVNATIAGIAASK